VAICGKNKNLKPRRIQRVLKRNRKERIGKRSDYISGTLPLNVASVNFDTFTIEIDLLNFTD